MGQYQPVDWPIDAPTYHSLAGWEFEKKLALDKLKAELSCKRPTMKQLNKMYDRAKQLSDVTPGFKYLRIACRIVSHIRQRNHREYAEFCKSNLS